MTIRISKHYTVILCLFMFMLSLTGCKNPLSEKYYMVHPVSPAELRRIDAMKLDNYTRSTNEESSKPYTPSEQAESPEKMELDIEAIRAMAIENNLTLAVSLLDPTIASQSIREEQARFEWLLFGNSTLRKSDTPTASLLDGSSAETITTNSGIRVPLTTGGQLEASLPISRQETNNGFSTLNPAYDADARFSITQPLLRNAGPRTNTHSIRVARYNSQITEARTKLQVMSVIADVDRLYWQLYLARETLNVRVQQHELAQRQLDRAKRQVDVGAAAEIEVIRAESGVAERLEAIIVAENQLRLRQRSLKAAIRGDLSVGTRTQIIPTTVPNPRQYLLDAGKLADLAMSKRLELLEIEIQLATDSSEINFARNQVLPVFNLTYVYGVNGLGSTLGGAFDLVADKNFEDHTISMDAEIPLGNQRAKSQLRRALLNRLQRLASKQEQQLVIRQEVLNAVDTVETNYQRILAAQRRTILASRTFEGEQRQFELGLRTSTEVLESQANLADAQLAELQAVTDYEIAQIDLAVATGTLLGAADVTWEPAEPETK